MSIECVSEKKFENPLTYGQDTDNKTVGRFFGTQRIFSHKIEKRFLEKVLSPLPKPFPVEGTQLVSLPYAPSLNASYIHPNPGYATDEKSNY